MTSPAEEFNLKQEKLKERPSHIWSGCARSTGRTTRSSWSRARSCCTSAWSRTRTHMRHG